MSAGCGSDGAASDATGDESDDDSGVVPPGVRDGAVHTSNTTPDGGDADVTGDAGQDASEEDAGEQDAGPTEPPEPPSVRFIGRFDTTAADGPRTSWPAAQIVARFHGTEVKATFRDTKSPYHEYGTSRWEAIVDGVSTTFHIARATTTYTLASELPLGDHTVELWKLTEASVGSTQFLGFEFPGGSLLAPPPRKSRRLEFLGDSGSNGYGVDGAPGCSFSSATQNAHKAYPALVAEDLGADHHNLSASGKGVFYNLHRPDLDVFPSMYPRTFVYGAAPLWDFTTYTPDVVWITLGGNDYSDPDYNPMTPPEPPSDAQFDGAYDGLVTSIRSKYPDAHVVCSVAASLSDTYPAGYQAYTKVKTRAAAVVDAKNTAGDAKVYFFEFTRAAAGETSACDGHVNAAKHRAMADEAVTFLRSKTGW